MNEAIIAEPNKMKRKILGPCSRSSKRLRFSSYSELIVTEPKSSSDIRNAWYTKKERAQFKSNILLASQSLRETRTAKAMSHIARSAATGLRPADIHVKGKEIIHGIEHLISPEVLKHLLIQRRKLITAVINTHRAQKMAGSGIDPLITAQVSKANSSFSEQWCTRITDFQSS